MGYIVSGREGDTTSFFGRVGDEFLRARTYKDRMQIDASHVVSKLTTPSTYTYVSKKKGHQIAGDFAQSIVEARGLGLFNSQCHVIIRPVVDEIGPYVLSQN